MPCHIHKVNDRSAARSACNTAKEEDFQFCSGGMLRSVDDAAYFIDNINASG